MLLIWVCKASNFLVYAFLHHIILYILKYNYSFLRSRFKKFNYSKLPIFIFKMLKIIYDANSIESFEVHISEYIFKLLPIV